MRMSWNERYFLSLQCLQSPQVNNEQYSLRGSPSIACSHSVSAMLRERRMQHHHLDSLTQRQTATSRNLFSKTRVVIISFIKFNARNPRNRCTLHVGRNEHPHTQRKIWIELLD
jgi:hypothetical protein